jgi:hypothetical protein
MPAQDASEVEDAPAQAEAPSSGPDADAAEPGARMSEKVST